jgi:hypothetical protein
MALRDELIQDRAKGATRLSARCMASTSPCMTELAASPRLAMNQ